MHFITSRDELRRVYKPASENSLRKELKALDGHSVSFIGRSPFVLIGTSDGKGHADVTPKGDRPGFVAVLDNRTIAIPDRPGNNRLDTLENLLVEPSIGLLFLIPGMDETLRINGKAKITADDSLRARFEVDGKLPQAVILVEVEAAYMHCAKAFMRSQLWHPETWPERNSMPTLGQMLKDQLALDQSAEAMDSWLDDAYAKSMW
ncbi:MAG: pyridoxamine 5'-phosphate oxidase family protein [Mesorhizobium sp.]|nr:pyridoxamine 5'-phosphate oxidase family protein [Mesorhizobium sp.]